jgi:Replication initiator protein A
MEANRSADRAEHTKQSHDKLYMENTLLRVAGALFCHDAKRAPTRTQEIELNKGVKEKNIVIRPDPRLGQPGPLAHKVFVALIKKHSDYGRPIQKEISFTKREIMRMVGRKTWGGSDSEELSRALHEIHYAFIKTQFKESDARLIEHSFNIFPQIWIERREFASDPIEACTITLADPIISSLEDEHFTCLNHALMMSLGTIGQALYMRLFFHLANLYDGANRQRLVFQKRYDDICIEWLGGLTVLMHKSKIVGEQLGRHLDQLAHAGFLSSYRIEGAKTQGKGGFTISFVPGTTFFDDYDRFYRRRQQVRTHWDSGVEHKETSEPLKVAYLFAEKRTGHPLASIAFVPSKDVETAKQLLAELPADELPAFFDYALAEARKTDFDVQTLGGIKQYLPSYTARKKYQAAAKVRDAARQRMEQKDAEQHAYDTFRRSEAAGIFESLPQTQRVIIEAEAQAHAAKFTGSLRDTMMAFGKVRSTIERHADKLTTFEQWKAARATS